MKYWPLTRVLMKYWPASIIQLQHMELVKRHIDLSLALRSTEIKFIQCRAHIRFSINLESQ